MWRPGLPELLIILVLILLLFGPGRITKIAGELGSGIRAFREGLEKKNAPEAPADSTEDETPPRG